MKQAANSACTSSSITQCAGRFLQCTLLGKSCRIRPTCSANSGTPTALTIYLGWAGNTLSAANTLLTNTVTGEAPQLSCPNPSNTITGCGSGTQSYGYYDDGANVFNYYQSFPGSRFPSTWSTSGSGYAYTVANGITIRPSGGSTGSLYTINNEIFNGISILDSYTMFTGTLPSGSAEVASGIGGNLYIGTSGGSRFGIWYYISSFTTNAMTYHSGAMEIYSTFIKGTGTGYGYLNYSPQATLTGAYTSNSQIFVLGQTNMGVSELIQWTRTRIYPPNGIMPGTTYGTVQPAYTPPTTPTLTLSNTLIDQGQSILFTASFTANTGTYPYTYNYLIVNSITNTVIANQLYTGNYFTSNTFFWTPPSALYTANTFKANVIITDSANTPTSTNSVYNAFGYNALLAVSVTGSGIIDNGQSLTLTSNPSGGTQPYSYLWTGGLTCSGGQTSTTCTASPSSTTTETVTVTDSASQVPTTNSASGTITVNSFPTANLILSNVLLDSGQTLTAIFKVSGGISPFTANLVNVTGNKRQGSSNIIVFTISGTNSISFVVSSQTNGNTFTYQYNAVDYGSSAGNVAFNSPYNTITVNTVLQANPITPAAPTIDMGQSILFNANPSGGTLGYSYQWYTNFGSLASCSSNAISGATSSTYLASPTTTNSYAYLVTDSATTPVSLCSASDTVTVNNGLSVSIYPISNTIFLSQSELFTAIINSGTAPYTYNWLLTNSINGIIANALYVNNAFTMNQFTYTFIKSGVYYANVTVTDSATTPVTVNSIQSIITAAGVASLSCINNQPFPAIMNGIYYQNMNTSQLTIFSDSATNVTGYFASTPLAREVVRSTANQINQTGLNISWNTTNSNQSTTLIVPASYYLQYQFTGKPIFTCEWLSSTSSSSNSPSTASAIPEVNISVPPNDNIAIAAFALAIIAIGLAVGGYVYKTRKEQNQNSSLQ